MTRSREESPSVWRQRTLRHLRLPVILFLAAGIATLGLLSDGEHRPAQAVSKRNPMKDYFPPDLPPYPDTSLLPAGRNNRTGGTRSRMAYFATSDAPDKVALFYIRFWKRRGFWVNQDLTHRGGMVAAVDAAHSRIYQVLTVRNDEKTTAFISMNDSPMHLFDPGKEPPVPLFPKSRILLNWVNDAGANEAHSILSINEGTLTDNVTYYQSRLEGLGLKRSMAGVMKKMNQRDPKGDMRMLVYSHRRGGEITVTITRLADRQTRVHIVAIGRIGAMPRSPKPSRRSGAGK